MKKIAIIGGGISGLYIANLFKDHKDYQVTIYEKRNSIEMEEGYGIQLSVNSVKLLNKIGFTSFTEEEKFNPKKIDFYEIKNLKKICDLDISKFNSEDCKYTTLKRSKLLQFLKKQINEDIIKYSHNIEQIDYDKDSIKLIFDKNKITCDYLIISDGVFSKGKLLISNNKSKPIYNDTIAIRGGISRENLQNINEENISLFLGPNFHYVVYPINNDKNLNFIGILKHKLNSYEQENYNLFTESSFIKNIKFKDKYSMTVVIASKGYPEDFKKLTEIKNIQNLQLSKKDYLFHAGTKFENNKWLSNGGRVLNFTHTGENLTKIRFNIHKLIQQISWDEGYYRKDIGWRYIDE